MQQAGHGSCGAPRCVHPAERNCGVCARVCAGVPAACTAQNLPRQPRLSAPRTWPRSACAPSLCGLAVSRPGKCVGLAGCRLHSCPLVPGSANRSDGAHCLCCSILFAPHTTVNLKGYSYVVAATADGQPSVALCPVNTYSTGLRKQRACVPCPSGMTTLGQTGASAPTACGECLGHAVHAATF